MADIVRLIDKWRRQSADSGFPSSYAAARRETLRDCAEELELAWHEHAHDGEWDQNCLVCQREMAANQ